MKKLSETYKELGIDFTFPIVVKDKNDNETYCEDSDGFWDRYEYDKNGNKTRYENSNGYWYLREYDENGNKIRYKNSTGFWYHREYDEKGNETYRENSKRMKRGTKRGSCNVKVIEIDGKKYKLTEL